MSSLKVGLVQINNSFSGQNYFPTSVASLQAYAMMHLADPKACEFLLPIYSRIPVEKAVAQLAGADVAAFSLYVWNAQISLKIAEALKKRSPETVIVFGGPHVPDRVEPFLRKNPFIDLACHGEGEQVFVSLLENAGRRDWFKVPSLSWIKPDGSIGRTERAPRLKDLTDVPSPFLTGVFDPLMKANPDEHWIVVWETNRGCPFSCTFCDWGSAVANKVNAWDVERLKREMDWFGGHKIEFIFCADANFGILPRDIEIAQYCAQTKSRFGYPQAMSVQNTKNATERSYEVQKILSDSGLNKGVVVSLQSVDAKTLKAIKRDNISLATYHEIQRRFTARGIETMTDLILGLPEETYDSFVDGVSMVIGKGQHNRIQFNNLSILPNAEMGDPEYLKRYGMITVESHVANMHGGLSHTIGDIEETQELVIATESMPKPDWVRARAFCWTAGLLHFNKVLQIPLIVLHEVADLRYRTLLELFSEGLFETLPGGAPGKFPILAEIRRFFLEKAAEIQNGGVEYCHSKEWLDIWWPADEYMLIKICREGKLEAFCKEAESAFGLLLREYGGGVSSAVLKEAILLNQSLLKQPFQKEDLDLELNHNVGEFYKAARLGRPISLEHKPSRYHIDRTSEAWNSWDEWCQKVIWYGNKKGAYLYGTGKTDAAGQIAGHH